MRTSLLRVPRRDVVVAAVVTALTVPPALVPYPQPWWVLALAVLTSVPLLWRRRAVLAVGAVVGGAMTVLAVVDRTLAHPPMLLLPYGVLVCTYTFAARRHAGGAPCRGRGGHDPRCRGVAGGSGREPGDLPLPRDRHRRRVRHRRRIAGQQGGPCGRPRARAARPGKGYGAVHTIELPFMFGSLRFTGIIGGAEGFAADRARLTAVSDRMIDAWTSFARTGNPSARRTAPRPVWPAYRVPQRATMMWNPVPGVAYDPRGGERALWDGHPFGPFDLP